MPPSRRPPPSPLNPFLSPEEDIIASYAAPLAPRQPPPVHSPTYRTQFHHHPNPSYSSEQWATSSSPTLHPNHSGYFSSRPSSSQDDRIEPLGSPGLPPPLRSPGVHSPLMTPSRTSLATEDGWTKKYAPMGGHAAMAKSQDSLPGPYTGESTDELPLTNKEPRRKSFFSRTKASICRNVHPKVVWEMFFDIREYFWPLTPRKAAMLLFVAAAVAGIVVSNYYFGWIYTAMDLTRSWMLPVMILVVGLEPTFITVVLLVARVPDKEPETNTTLDEKNFGDLEKSIGYGAKAGGDHRTALVIPCHDSDEDAMKKVLESAYPHFRPQDIFIIDNGRSKYPKSDRFRKFIYSQHKDINYIWSPIGSKNAAQLVGALAAKDHEFIMTVDDDVCIPPNYHSPIEKINEKTKAVAFPISAVDAEGNVSLFLVAWQDCEYRMAGVTKIFEDKMCGVIFPHGAGWFVERETLIELISKHHSLDFIAEDGKSGMAMQKMKKLIAFEPNIILETEVPSSLLGQGLCWWKQRYKSWEMGRHSCLLLYTQRLLFSLNGQTTIKGILTQKFMYMYNIACMAVDWVRVPCLVALGQNAVYWYTGGMLIFVSILPLLYYKYVTCRRRPDLQPRLVAVLTIWVYKQLYALVSIFGMIRCVCFYVGGHRRPESVREMMDKSDDRIFWEDPRFKENPAFLADEGEAMRKAQNMQEVSAKSSAHTSMTATDTRPPTMYGATAAEPRSVVGA
ncbi:hypothetical protein BDY21DRAFT_307189 [Lineolata rhizophorae]|uniref:Uncharacterized protein n=1 Tax=Lineolata rhizophorae TaxID=578093 RepID=A0A6A6NVF5_9PEZI|nr:hypothetical protein BDY21DRAFT_307189 [Lineolata rhizophorae]